MDTLEQLTAVVVPDDRLPKRGEAHAPNSEYAEFLATGHVRFVDSDEEYGSPPIQHSTRHASPRRDGPQASSLIPSIHCMQDWSPSALCVHLVQTAAGGLGPGLAMDNGCYLVIGISWVACMLGSLLRCWITEVCLLCSMGSPCPQMAYATGEMRLSQLIISIKL